MARFLLTVWPFPGHLYPNIALAQSLRARGHDVALYSGGAARSVVESEGFTFFAFRRVAEHLRHVVDGSAVAGQVGSDDAAFYDRLTARYARSYDFKGINRGRLLSKMYFEWLLGTVPQQVADLEEILTKWHPDVIVSDTMMWGPYVVLQELRRLPVALLSFWAGCFVPGPDAPPTGLGWPPPRTWLTRLQAKAGAAAVYVSTASIRREVSRVRQRHGLPPLRGTVLALSGRVPLHLVTTSPEYDYQRRDLPNSVYYIGACLWDRPRREPASPWVATLPSDRSTVYVSEGTSMVRASTILRAARDGLAGLPIQAILTTGRHRDPAQLDLLPAPPNVRVERFVPLSDLLPYLGAVVTVGGSGTVHAAIAAGVPLVIIPQEWDQFENAQRVVTAGAGLRLDAAHCTPARLRWAVRRVLTEPSFRANAQRLAAAAARYGGPERAAELLERLAPPDVHRSP